ncbi:hypothetical protein ACET3Z_021347 [Daucus carota]
MASTIVQSLDENQSVTARETFNFTKLSELDTEHFQDNHCIGKFQKQDDDKIQKFNGSGMQQCFCYSS